MRERAAEGWRGAVMPVYHARGSRGAAAEEAPPRPALERSSDTEVHSDTGGGSSSATSGGGNSSGGGGSGSRKRSKLGKNEYAVEKIVDVKRERGGVSYLIKWKGWTAKYNTWEPVGHLENLEEEIAQFEASRA